MAGSIPRLKIAYPVWWRSLRRSTRQPDLISVLSSVTFSVWSVRRLPNSPTNSFGAFSSSKFGGIRTVCPVPPGGLGLFALSAVRFQPLSTVRFQPAIMLISFRMRSSSSASSVSCNQDHDNSACRHHLHPQTPPRFYHPPHKQSKPPRERRREFERLKS